MNYSILFEFDHKSGILIRTFKGIVTINDLLDSWKYIIEQELCSGDFKGVITDFRETDFQVEMIELRVLDAFFKENMESICHLSIAQIIDSPKIAFPILLAKQYPHLRLKAFSTLKAAKEWILLSTNSLTYEY